jgi:hypothetical protein
VMSKRKEYAVQITWPARYPPEVEFVPAVHKRHAEDMIRQIYRGLDAVVVERKVSDWSPVSGEVES